MASYIRLYGIVARGDYIIDSLDLLRDLIPLKCINDPSSDLKPDAICVKGVKEGMRRSGMDPRSFESGGFYIFFDVYGSGKPMILHLAQIPLP